MYDGLLLFIQEIKDIILNFMERLRVRDPSNRGTCKINEKKTRTDQICEQLQLFRGKYIITEQNTG